MSRTALKRAPEKTPPTFAALRKQIRAWLVYHHPDAVDVQLILMNPAGYAEYQYRIVGDLLGGDDPPPLDPK